MFCLNESLSFLQISEMYEIMKKTDSISQILPQTVERLLALSDIHQQGIIIQQVLLCSFKNIF